MIMRRILSLFFATLTLVFSVTCYTPSDMVVVPGRWAGGEDLAWVSSAATPGYAAQEGASSTGNQVWRYEIGIPGLFFRKESPVEPPRLQIIRKIYVVDACNYTPCKSLLLYPFHEFS